MPGTLAVALFLIWAVHDGGYDAETWYWGALASLSVLVATIWALGGRLRLGRGTTIALATLATYVAWCYLSITWAQSPGDALQGANQALLYLLVFAVMVMLPWTAGAAMAILVAYVVGVGVIAVVLLFRLASADHVASLVIQGRLAAPTGYFNSTAALFTVDALTAIALATRRELPGLLRGLLLALACAGLQLALIVQSRGWLFTLPIVGLVAIFVVKDRLRIVAATVIPVLGTVAIVHRLLAVYASSGSAAVSQAAGRAAQPALLICAGAMVVGTLLAWADSLRPAHPLSTARRRMVGSALAALAFAALVAGGSYATHGHPARFISRQWNGFSREQTSFSRQSHFGDAGSGRYDFWRVALDAFVAYPIGGLGEDNFGGYYIRHRRTAEEPSSTHSLELRFLAQTGIVGFGLFAAFLISALRLAARARRSQHSLAAALAGIALLPLLVWLIHGSIDWFWEMPALSGPALGFLGVAGALHHPRLAPHSTSTERPRRRLSTPPNRMAAGFVGAAALLAGVLVLGIPYLSVREVSLGSDAAATNPRVALSDFATAGDLNPLSAVPGRLAGVVALSSGQNALAERRFEESIHRDPGGWFAWLGAGLAASAQGHTASAEHYLRAAYAINDQQPAIRIALSRVFSAHPLTSAQAFKLLIVQ